MSDYKSLPEVHESVKVQNSSSFWKRFLSFVGPAYMISVGYMDPGNWATDLAGGSQFGYTLLWVLLLSNIIALLLQSLCTRLGIVGRMDLAQCNRHVYPKGLNFILYILAEISIAACDLAEILGMAIGLQLLFGIDLIYGVLISFLDTFLLLWLQKFGIKKMERFIVGLIFLIGSCFLIEMIIAKPDLKEVATGFIPSIPNKDALYIAIGIIGATVMPHNLYLHSSLVQTRKIDRDRKSIKEALKYNFIDTAIALNFAFFVNAAILILAATAFFKTGQHHIAELEDAHDLLPASLGTEWASKLFAIALIAAGQSSTITGTLAGQIIMEGYLHLKLKPVVRRLITRGIAIIPAVCVILWMGEESVGKLLIFSQVILSMQLAFAVIPLIHFVSSRKLMGDFIISLPMKIISWVIAFIISFLNLKLVWDEGSDLLSRSENPFIEFLVYGAYILLIIILLLTLIIPLKKLKKV